MSRTSVRRVRTATAGVVLGVVVALLAACSGGTGGPTKATGTSPINTSSSVRGEHIVILLPSYAQIPKALLAQFTTQTGVTVTENSADFDAIHQQLVTAATSGTNIADVAELDWSWVGQFGKAGWYTPLTGSFDTSVTDDMLNIPTFTYQNKLIGIPYSNDFRVAAYNQKKFTAAGITAAPKTFDELTADLKTLKAKGTQYPFGLSLSATEGTSTLWYLLTLAMGGQLFDASLKPQFTDPSSIGAKALQFEVDAVKSGLVNPGAVSNTDQQSDDRFLSGDSAYTFGGPDELVAADDPSSSKIVGQAALALMPGASGPGVTFGAPEALGIPASSKHKAAALAFLKWMSDPTTVATLRTAIGVLPARKSVLQSLNSSGKLKGGDVILEEATHVQALFPQGVPTWYSKFSTNAAAVINSAAKGQISVADAMKRIAAQAGG